MISISPTSRDHIGEYSLRIKLTDNGGDSEDPPPEKE